jgi:hypothetical protein
LADERAMDAAVGDPGEGGDAACWAHLVCPECGAVESEGHVAGCGFAAAAGQGPVGAAGQSGEPAR